MTGTQTAQQVESAAQHAETAAEQAGGIDVGGHILHHILDSNELEIVLPFIRIPLPHFELFGVDADPDDEEWLCGSCVEERGEGE